MVDGSASKPPIPRGGESPEVLVTVLNKELRRVAAAFLRRERPNHTLQPTALVNETYVRLASQGRLQWDDRARFLASASHLMREILVDYARSRNRAKRGGGQVVLTLGEDAGLPSAGADAELLALDEALERLERIDSQQRRIVELRYFGGLNIDETAEVLGISSATVKRDWRSAKAWLHRELSA